MGNDFVSEQRVALSWQDDRVSPITGPRPASWLREPGRLYLAPSIAGGTAMRLLRLAVFILLLPLTVPLMLIRILYRAIHPSRGGASPDANSDNFVTIKGSTVSIREFRSEEDYAPALAELRAIKRELAIKKRLVRETQKRMRSNYTAEVRQRGLLWGGTGSSARALRRIQLHYRSDRRARLARDLAPLEGDLHSLEAIALQVDMAIGRLSEIISDPGPEATRRRARRTHVI